MKYICRFIFDLFDEVGCHRHLHFSFAFVAIIFIYLRADYHFSLSPIVSHQNVDSSTLYFGIYRIPSLIPMEFSFT